MTVPMHGRRKAGFTLIELLVVIAIMALLAALAVGTYFRVRTGQDTKSTEATLAKINAGLNRLWTANREQAEKEFREGTLPNGNSIDTLVTFCGADRDRAKSLWVYLRMKNEFPQNFFEAKNATTLQDSSNKTVVSLPARRTFAANSAINSAAITAAPSQRQDGADQAAALLYLIVTEKATRGEDYGDSATGATARDLTVNGGTFRVFRDSWGSPIYYVRFATNNEINAAPYLKPGTTSKDPFDPKGRLTASWTNQQLAASWLFSGVSNKTQSFQNQNWMPTVISPGANRDVDAATNTNDFSVDLSKDPSTLTPPGLFTLDPTTDDILGYRLRREGNRGD